MKMKINFVIIGIVILIASGCVQAPKEKAVVTPTIPAPTAVPVTVMPTVAVATATPTPQVTPAPKPKELPPGTFYVVARMETPVYWSPGKYELKKLEVDVINQYIIPRTVKAQIVSGGDVLEERTFTFEDQGSRNAFTNEKTHFISKPTLMLRLIVAGYEPVEYKFEEVSSLS